MDFSLPAGLQDTSAFHPLRLLVEHTPAAIALFDTDLRYIIASRRWLEDYGLGDRNIIGQCHYDIFPEIGEEWKVIHQNCLQGAIERREEEAFPRSDGGTDWLKWEVRPWHTESGDVGGLIMFTEVITRQKEAELALAQANQDLEAINQRLETQLAQRSFELNSFFELTEDMLGIAGFDGHFKRVNPAFERNLGYTQAEFFAQPFIAFVHPDDQDSTVAAASEITEGERVVSFENRYRCKDGSYRWLSWTSAPDLDAQVIYATARDITEQKEAEAALRKQAKLLDQVKGAIIALDNDGIITTWGKGAEDLYGYTAQEAIGQHVRMLYPERLHHYLRTGIIEPLKAKGQHEVETQIINKAGQEIDVLIALSLEKDTEGNVIGRIGYGIDITERKQAEAQINAYSETLEKTLEELKQTQLQMIQAEKMSSLGQLVAGIAHEINNPVNFIFGNLTHAKGYTHDLLEIVRLYQEAFPEPGAAIEAAVEDLDLDFLTEDLPKLLASMKVGADRIRTIVLSLRNFSRMDEVDLKDADIHEGIDSTVMILHHRLKKQSDRPEIIINRDYGTLPRIECFPGQLNQVFMNILTNGIDALEDTFDAQTPGTPTITIKTDLEGEQTAVIAIADNGRGMPDSVRDRIFNPFFTTKDVGKGTGMGLSISYQVVTEKHGGTLTCHSTPGQGTEFVIRIPVRQS
jgi:PAS domain S-box-containing protein